MHSTLIESVQDGAQILRQTAATFQLQFSGDAEECLCDGACDGGQSIAVAAEGYCSTNHIFEVFALQEGGDGLRDRFLTAFHMPIAGADLIAGTVQIITKDFRNILLDFRLGATGSGQKDGCGSGLCALDALGVIVRDLGREPRHPQDRGQIIIEPTGGTDPHGRAVAPAVVGLGGPIAAATR